MKSSFCWALLIFTIANCILYAEDRSKGITADTVSEQQFDYAGTEESPKYLNRTANVLLLGSSLLLHPEWCVDKTIPINEPYGKMTIISMSHYHLAQGLGNELTRVGFQKPFVYNLAASGALISDSYLLLFHYLKNHPKPATIVLDCAPRSFSDTGVTAPDATPIFDYCFRIQDYPELHSAFLKGRDANVNYILSTVFFTYHHRKWLCETAQKSLVKPLTDVVQTYSTARAQPLSKPIAASIPSAPIASDSAPTVSRSEESIRMEKSLQEYKDRYQFMNRNCLVTQLKFLQLIEDLCAEKQIKLIVVNMPLSKDNRRLLAEGFYDDFRADVAKTIGSRAIFIDLASGEDWPSSCYHDTVHLNDKGGARLNEIIAQTITSAQAHSRPSVNQ